MIEVIFNLNGKETKEMFILANIQQMKRFLENPKEEVLKVHPSAEDVKVGECYVAL